jgi:hypothetical protein
MATLREITPVNFDEILLAIQQVDRGMVTKMVKDSSYVGKHSRTLSDGRKITVYPSDDSRESGLDALYKITIE